MTVLCSGPGATPGNGGGRALGRRVLLQSSAAALGVMAAGGIGAPAARAAAFWNPGPKSGLPFWIGNYGAYSEIAGLMPASRAIDLVHEFEPEGPYEETVRATKAWFNRSEVAALLASGAAAGFQWTSMPFCWGNKWAPPAAWPASADELNGATWLNPMRPPTFTGSESRAEQSTKQRRVWRMAADGWLDRIWWWKFIEIKRGFFIRNNLRNTRIVLRVAHELNLLGPWGATAGAYAANIGRLDSNEDAAIVKEALRRYIAIFTDVFGRTRASIPGDFAYRQDQLWPYWNPVPEQRNVFNVCDTCPPNAKLAGPDIYDFWPASMTDAEFRRNIAMVSGRGYPRGMKTWCDWATSTGRLFAVGEFGLMTTATTADGTRPPHEGWDNPVFIRNMLDFARDRADQVAFMCYFNRDVAPRLDLPGHRIAPWPGIENPAVACARTPVGDVNRCGARAWRTWMAR